MTPDKLREGISISKWLEDMSLPSYSFTGVFHPVSLCLFFFFFKIKSVYAFYTKFEKYRKVFRRK